MCIIVQSSSIHMVDKAHLPYSPNLTLDGVVLCISASGTLMARHIHTKYVKVFRQILHTQKNTSFVSCSPVNWTGIHFQELVTSYGDLLIITCCECSGEPNGS